MGENSKIEWTDHTFNPWRGCTKVAAGCANCYAETQSKRFPKNRGVWGPSGTRVIASEAMWRKPLKWNDAAGCRRCTECVSRDHHWIEQWDQATEADHACKHCSAIADGCLHCCNGLAIDSRGRVVDRPCRICRGAGVNNVRTFRPRVFCASLADVFEDWNGPMVDSQGEQLYRCPCGSYRHLDGACPKCGKLPHSGPLTMNDVRRRLFALIDATPNLDWLLVTKRPEHIRWMWPSVDPDVAAYRWGKPGGYNVARHRPNVWLLTSISTQADADKNIPELLKCRDLAPVLGVSAEPLLEAISLHNWVMPPCLYRDEPGSVQQRARGEQIRMIDWGIAGGESGPGARPCNIAWIRLLRDQCQAAGVPIFVKQLGSFISMDGSPPAPSWSILGENKDGTDAYRTTDKKGGDWAEWPADLRVREFPEVAQQ